VQCMFLKKPDAELFNCKRPHLYISLRREFIPLHCATFKRVPHGGIACNRRTMTIPIKKINLPGDTLTAQTFYQVQPHTA